MRAAIIHVGRIENGSPVDWSFDSYTNIPALSVSGRGILYYGYTVSELETIIQINPVKDYFAGRAVYFEAE